MFKEQPRPKIMKDWYAPVEEMNKIFKEIRLLGLYRDEHKDFTDEMERLR